MLHLRAELVKSLFTFKHSKAFTLVELLVVVAVIVILTALGTMPHLLDTIINGAGIKRHRLDSWFAPSTSN
jgi:prepilin-type N-terminal cleavage/methylation domain-containing protein